jgi:hypothetical protein
VSLRHAFAAVAVAATCASGLACPSRDLTVQITADGAQTLSTACEAFRGACAGAACHADTSICTQDTCQLRQICKLGDNPQWSASVTMGMRLLLVTVTPDSLTIKTSSPCVPLNLRPCILDPTETTGCMCIVNPLDASMTCEQDLGDAQQACMRDTLALAVESAMGTGFSFSGFTSTDGVALVAAFYQKPDQESSCSTSVLVNPSDCTRQQLTAVAGLGTPSGSANFDITCASCQAGPHDAVGPDNGPCPATTNACFLQRVASALQAAGM